MSLASRARIVSGAAKSAPRGLPVGISIGSDSALTSSGDHGLAQYQAMKAAGFWGVRVDAAYPTGPGTNVDASISAALAAGLNVLLILDGYQTTVGVSSFAAFCTTMVNKYTPLGVHNYEILNEPNSSGAWDSTNHFVNPSGYATLAAAVYTAVKAADPHSFVVLGACAVFAGADGASQGSGNYLTNLLPATWMGLIYQANGGTTAGLCDAIGLHPYPSAAGAPSTSNNWGVALNPPGVNSFYAVNYTTISYGNASVLAVMTVNGEGSKPIWITECGYNTSTVTTANQATFNAACINQAKAIPNIGAFFVFNWNDDSDGNYGLVDSSYVAKTSLATVTGLVTGIPAKLVYTTPPPSSVGTTLPFTVVVALQDAAGNTQTTNNTTPVTLTAAGGFSCPSPPTHFTNGLATFANCTFTTTTGSPDTITAASGNLTPATFSTTVVAGPSGSTPALNVVAGISNGSTPTSLTWTHVVGAGSNRMLFAAVAYNGAGTLSGVTYGGVAMTLLSHATNGSAAALRSIDVWYLSAPTSGSASVVSTFSVSPSGASAKSLDYSSVYLGNPFGTPSTNIVAASPVSAVVTTAAANVILSFLGLQYTVAPTYTNGSQSALFAPLLAGTNVYLAATTIAGGSAVSTGFTWTGGTGGNAAMTAFGLVGA